MKIVAISDTHEKHEQVKLPEGDVLVHAGDLTFQGHVREVQFALDWLNAQPHKDIVLIAGNHDFCFEHESLKAKLNFGRIHYLEDSGVEIDGKKFWGSPVQPWFHDWAFNRFRGPEIQRHWDLIPDDTDVLITHGPPQGVLDQAAPRQGSDNLGCEMLTQTLLSGRLKKVKLHIFGHIHGGYGMELSKGIFFANASVVDEAYRVKNAPIVFEL